MIFFVFQMQFDMIIILQLIISNGGKSGSYKIDPQIFMTTPATVAVIFRAIVLHGCAAIIMTIITPIIMHDNRLDNTLLYDYYNDYCHA